ncbi:MAG: hypothetical protein ACTSQE_09100 [Candidatus Heimdallarchaeaceae archaeon]
MYDKIIRSIVFPTLSKVGLTSIWTKYNELKKEFYLSIEEKRKLVKHRALELIKTLYDIPYYQALLKDSEKNEIMDKPVKFLRSLPILTREKIQENDLNFFVNNKLMQRAQKNSTSGSTGRPISFFNDFKFNDYRYATLFIYNELTGWKIGEKHISLWGFHPTTTKGRFFNKYLYRITQFPPYFDNKRDVEQVVYSMNKIKPKLITGYSSALVSFAQKLEEYSLELDFEPKGIIASAEGLLPYQKKIIEQNIGSKVYMRYGSREVGGIAMQCQEQEYYHILDTRYIIDIVDEDNNSLEEGESGKIIITDLFNHVMPFIRYEIGDIGSLTHNECTCGIPGLKFKEVDGRITDFIELPNGSKLPLLTLNVVMEQSGDFVQMFQLKVENKNEWKLYIIPKRTLRSDDYSFIIDRFNMYTNNLINIKIEEVENLYKTKAGKQPIIIYN